MEENRETTRGSGETATAEERAESPLKILYPGESVRVVGRDVWVKPWGVKALMTQIPGLVGGLMAKLAPVFTASREGLGNEAVLAMLMENAGEEIVQFTARSAGLSDAEIEEMTAAEFVMVLRAIVRQNADFFVALGGLYEELGKPITSVLGVTGSRS